jgi:uncharacterized protein
VKLLRRYAVWLVTVVAMLGVHARAETVSQLPMPTSYVEDFAGVIDEGSKAQMEALSREISEKAHATIMVVTIHSLEGESIDQFTNDLYTKWKVGPKDTDRGVLMILAINDHKRRIEVGYGLEGILNDAKVGDIGRSMVPLLQQNQFGPALLSGQRQIAAVIAADANVTLTSSTQPIQQPDQQQHRRQGNNLLGLIVFIFIIIFFVGGGRGGGWLPFFIIGNMFGSGRGGGRWRGGGGGFGGGGGGGDFGGGFGGSSGGGGASGDW